MPLIKVSEKTKQTLEQIRNQEQLKSLDSAIRLTLLNKIDNETIILEKKTTIKADLKKILKKIKQSEKTALKQDVKKHLEVMLDFKYEEDFIEYMKSKNKGSVATWNNYTFLLTPTMDNIIVCGHSFLLEFAQYLEKNNDRLNSSVV